MTAGVLTFVHSRGWRVFRARGTAHLFSAWASFARSARGAVSLELGIGTVALVSVAGLCFDFYSRVAADTAASRMAAAMAEYVSRETDPDGGQIKALGQFLYEKELNVPANAAYVVSAVQDPLGDDPAGIVWSDRIPFGSEAAAAVAGACGGLGAEGGPASLPEGFAAEDGEAIVVVEVCVRPRREGSLTSLFADSDIYRLHARPTRTPGQVPARPVRADPEART